MGENSTAFSTGLDLLVNVGQGLAPIVKTAADRNGVVFEEDPDSPILEFGEQATCTHKFTGDWESCLGCIVSRGTYLIDSAKNIWRVLTCTITHGKGASKVQIVSESISFNPPPDEYEAPSNEFNPALEKHPRYAALSDLDRAAIHAALELPQELARTEAATAGNLYDPDTETNLYNLWNELLSKLRKGEDTYYLAGITVSWSRYYFQPVPKNEGGFTQDPTTVIPSQFWFTPLSGTGSALPAGWSWLRQADDETFVRTWFKVTYKWVGGPSGKWDPDIYSSGT